MQMCTGRNVGGCIGRIDIGSGMAAGACGVGYTVVTHRRDACREEFAQFSMLPCHLRLTSPDALIRSVDTYRLTYLRFRLPCA